MGRLISDNTAIISFKNKTLTIKTKTPVWRNELALKKKEIIEKLNNKLGEKLINDMRIT